MGVCYYIEKSGEKGYVGEKLLFRKFRVGVWFWDIWGERGRDGKEGISLSIGEDPQMDNS